VWTRFIHPWQPHEIADDGSSATFTLQARSQFHDGSDFNADVVKWNYDMRLKLKALNWKSVEVVDLIPFVNQTVDELSPPGLFL
jgi:ABC-type transport system substrate-binding protein